MDSYEYYLLYHQNNDHFVNKLRNNPINEEILCSLEKLFKNKKINENINEIFEILTKILQKDEESSFLIDKILEKFMTQEIYDRNKYSLLNTAIDHHYKLRILRIYTSNALKFEDEDFLTEIYNALIECLFKESTYNHYFVGLLNFVITENEKHGKMIVDKIYKKSLAQNDDNIGLQNLCYFFDRICKNGILKVDDIFYKILEKYFQFDHVARKQGIFLIKNLINNNLLDNINSWKTFNIIIESIEENQSHLILPTLRLLENVTPTKEFYPFWFIIVKQIITHENNLVKTWGLNFILTSPSVELNKEEILVILNALNSIMFYNQENEIINHLQSFTSKNFFTIYECLIEIEWISVVFYHILSYIKNHIQTLSSFSSKFIDDFEKQTDSIPKRLQNLNIRTAVQNLYAQILAILMEKVDVQQVVPIMFNIYKINIETECLDQCLHFITREDYDYIFCDKYPYEFLKYMLVKLHNEKSLHDIKHAARKIAQHHKLVMETIIKLNLSQDGYEEEPNHLAHEIIEIIWKNVTENCPEGLEENLNIIECYHIGLNAEYAEVEKGIIEKDLIEIWRHVLVQKKTNDNFENAYWKILSLILKYNTNFNISFVESECFNTSLADLKVPLQLVECQVSLIRNQFLTKNPQNVDQLKKAITNMEILLDRALGKLDLIKIYENTEVLLMIVSKEIIDSTYIETDLLTLLRILMDVFNNNGILTLDFLEKFILMISKLNQSSTKWTDDLITFFQTLSEKMNENINDLILYAVYKQAISNNILNNSDNLTNYFKNQLIKRIFEITLITKEHQIELIITSDDKNNSYQKFKFRYQITQYLRSMYYQDFMSAIQEKITELSQISKKKTRYFPYSQTHRTKLHYIQPLFFCDSLNEEILKQLLDELFNVNNQLNVTYLIEIILARHHPNILNILKGKTASSLKSQTLKSIFAIAIMQMKTQTDFDIVEKRMEEMFHAIFPYSMGQNFAVRIYSLLAMIISYEHVKSLSFSKTSITFTKVAEICDIIQEIVKQKNCLRFFNALKSDFRFTKSMNELWTEDTFYHQIPLATKMPFEEIIKIDEKKEVFMIADMMKESDQILMSDEIKIDSDVKKQNENSITVQQKYIPFKYQIPGAELLKTLPEIFKFYDYNEIDLSTKSEAIIVTSLIDRETNLGGLARTCEIFGITNYVIDSLNLIEHSEFKNLSKTAEKWIKIIEIKRWQLFDYLLSMKRKGFTIVGAEQTGSSVSLLDAVVPKKCVFLLGNEKEGIPANLLSLLDLVIEIPQMGVVRSLNVHVTGAVLMWEYAKRHIFKN